MSDQSTSAAESLACCDPSGRRVKLVNGYGLVAPEGAVIPITKEVFDAMRSFIGSKSAGTGRLVIDFSLGGIAAVKAIREQKYK